MGRHPRRGGAAAAGRSLCRPAPLTARPAPPPPCLHPACPKLTSPLTTCPPTHPPAAAAYYDYVASQDLPVTLAEVDPITSAVAGGAVGVLTAQLLEEAKVGAGAGVACVLPVCSGVRGVMPMAGPEGFRWRGMREISRAVILGSAPPSPAAQRSLPPPCPSLLLAMQARQRRSA